MRDLINKIQHYFFGCMGFIYSIHSHQDYQRGECLYCDLKYVLKNNKWELQWWQKN